MADSGAAVMIADKDVRQQLKETIISMLNDPQRLSSMSRASARLGKPQAGQEIAAAILGMIR